MEFTHLKATQNLKNVFADSRTFEYEMFPHVIISRFVDLSVKTNNSPRLARNTLGYFIADIICSEVRTVF